MDGLGGPFRWGKVVAVAALVAAITARAMPAAEPTLDELKARVSAARIGEKPRLCVEIAERQLTEADKFYAASQNDRGQADLTDVTSFSELARDYAIQSHKREKQTEIAVRGMIRRLNDILHTLPHEEQAPLKGAINRLQRVRDDLLLAMFPKAAQ
ncbi:MAG TPA: hypothetical protein VMD99_05020 [Terriglobales bacterium]|nr:hypothetical protein [Terriglobales bacterium]